MTFFFFLSRTHGARQEFRLGSEIAISSLTDFNNKGYFLLIIKLDCPFSLPHQIVNRCSSLSVEGQELKKEKIWKNIEICTNQR